jgi:hypothetical protein
VILDFIANHVISESMVKVCAWIIFEHDCASVGYVSRLQKFHVMVVREL